MVAVPTVGAGRAPEPGDDLVGRDAAVGVLALLRHQQNLCDDIAASVEEYWISRGSGDSEAVQTAVRDRILEIHAGELAEGRAAGAEARRILARLGREKIAAAASLERQRDLVTSLCDLVALPTAPRSRFSARLVELRRRIATEEEALGRILTVEDGELTARLLPFLPRLQTAGVAAEGELKEHRRAQRPPPPPPDPAGPMRAWHARYAPLARPVKESFRLYVEARASGDSGGLARACRELNASIPGLLRELEKDPGPEPRVTQMLSTAYRTMRRIAIPCAAGRQPEADEAYREFRSQLADATEAMSRWGIAP